MFEVVSARSGDEVVKLDGRLLSSKYDPKKEASSFVDSLSVDLEKFEYIFLIGASSGYEIRCLLDRHKSLKIVVFEENTALVEWIKSKIQSDRVQFISEPLGAFKTQAQVQKLLRKVYFTTILPAYRVNPSEIKIQFYELFQARKPEPFRQWQKLLKRDKHLNLNSEIKGDLISIKDVESDELSRLSSTYRVLRELIA